MNDKAEHYLIKLKKAVETDQLTLPTLPDVAMKIHQAVNSNDNSAQQIAEILSQDAALSARLLQLANSPLYRARCEIDSLQMAIARLGTRIVRDLVMALAIKQVFQSSSMELQEHFKTIWQRSVEIAAICRLLAAEHKPLEPEQAMLAGLMHNIGSLPILKLAEKDKELLDNPQQLMEISQQIQHKVAGIVLSFWNLPQHLVDATSGWHHFERQHNGDADYTDLVQAAILQSQCYEDAEWLPEKSTAIALQKLHLDADQNFFDDASQLQKLEDTRQSLGAL